MIPPAYAEARPFSQGLAPVRIASRWGYVTKTEGARSPVPADETVDEVEAEPRPGASQGAAPAEVLSKEVGDLVEAGRVSDAMDR